MGVAKNPNATRNWFSTYRKYEKCKPALPPPDVKSTKRGGRIPPWVMYCTFKRETPPLTGAGAEPPLGCAIVSSKNLLSCEVGTRKFLAAFARSTSGRIFGTRWPVRAEIASIGAQPRNFI